MPDNEGRRKRRSKSRSKKPPSKRVGNFLHKFGWFLIAALIGIPMLAAALYLLP